MPHIKLAAICFRHAYVVLFVWAALLVIAAHFALQLPSMVKGHGLAVADGSYEQAQRILASNFDIPSDPVIVYFERSEAAQPDAFRRFIAETLDRIQNVEGVRSVVPPSAESGSLRYKAAFAVLDITEDPLAADDIIGKLRQRLPHSPGMSAALTGKPVVQADVNRASRHDLQRAELIGLPIALVILRIAFGSFTAALLPILLGVSSVTGAMGLAVRWSERIPWSVFVLNVIPMAGLALGIDFALVLVGRFREELYRQPTPELAAHATMRTAGGAVFVSALCVLFGLTGILYLPMPIFTTVALAAMLTVGLSLLLSFTVLPALLAVAAPRLRLLQTKAAAKGTRRTLRPQRPRLAKSWAAAVLRRPIASASVGVAVLAGCMLPLAGMKLTVPDAGSLPRSYESRLAAEAYAAAGFEPAGTSRVYIIAESKTRRVGFSPVETQAVAEIANRLQADPLVVSVVHAASAAGLSPTLLPMLLQHPAAAVSYAPAISRYIHGNRALFIVTLAASPNSEAARIWARHAVSLAVKASSQTPSGIPVALIVGGEPLYEQELFDALHDKLPQAAAFILIANLVTLLLAFRSIIIPVKTVLMHALGLGAAFGIMTFVCQQGRFGLEPSGIAIMIPVFIFGLVFGISMDYGVFLLARIAEAHRRCGDNDAAVTEGLAAASGMITSAAAIMIAVTAPFATADVAGVRQLGIGVAAAIALDATIIRLLLVPALMKLLGHSNWWPGGPRTCRQNPAKLL